VVGAASGALELYCYAAGCGFAAVVLACDKDKRDSRVCTYLEEQNQRGSILHIALLQCFGVLKGFTRVDYLRGVKSRIMLFGQVFFETPDLLGFG
jgi:hypothetical protein